MARKGRQRFNWYTRHWSDLSEVYGTVVGVAKAHAEYLGYKVHGVGGYGPPAGDLSATGPVIRIRLSVSRLSGKHRQRIPGDMWVDVERRAGNKFHPKTAGVEPIKLGPD